MTNGPWIVTGMHRSGTSLVGGMLTRLGVDMGRRLVPADDKNPRGYFEDADVVEFHSRVFRELLPADAAGHADWGWTEEGLVEPGRLAPYAPEARALLDGRSRGRSFGFKDPRATVALDFWAECLPDARFVLVYRFPWEVSDSMQRGGAPIFQEHPSYGYRIWTAYNQRLLDFVERNPDRCLLVSSNAIAARPSSFTDSVAHELGLEPAGTGAGGEHASRGADFEAELFTRSDSDDRRADLVGAAYPEATRVLARLDALADVPACGLWRSEPSLRTPLRGPDESGTEQEPARVSVVVPTWNDGVLLLDALASAERYLPSACELVVVNDGSTDLETLRILEALRERGLFVLDKPNGGLSSARNAGIARTRSPYILPLDADNRLLAGFVEAAVEELDAHPELDVVYGDREQFGARQGLLTVPEFDLAKMLGGNYVDACAVYRRELWEETGGYDTALRGLEDWELWLHAGSRGRRFRHLARATFEYRVRPDSLLARSLLPGARGALLGHILRKHEPLFHEHVPALLKAPSTVLGRIVPAAWRERLQRWETRVFWRTLWYLIGPGGLFAAHD